MNNILYLSIDTPEEVGKHIAERVKVRRLELNLTQKGLAERAGLKFATYRRFEHTGDISLKGLLRVAFALNSLSDFEHLFSHKQYQTIDDVLNDNAAKHKRGTRR